MSANPIQITVHPSCFPARQTAAVQAALRTRQVPGKLHYLSTAQTQAWLAVHERHAPSRADEDCTAAYDAAFARATTLVRDGTEVAVVGLGAGGGQKDARMVRTLAAEGVFPVHLAHDVSVPMVITAVSAVQRENPNVESLPLVADLLEADDLPAVAESLLGDAPRVVLFFGLIPNFEPAVILPRLAALIRPQDVLLFSANLAPGSDYRAACELILSQYDNPETRAWLWLFLKDLGFEEADGTMRFGIEPCPQDPGLLRIVANWEQTGRREVVVGGDSFTWNPGDQARLFFSYRHTPQTTHRLLADQGLQIQQQWITADGAEGIFLCRRTP
jgi:uncharacterized SAM-dependent methyltransferase